MNRERTDDHHRTPRAQRPETPVHRRGGGCTRVPRLQRRRPSLQLLQAREAQADPLRGRHGRRPARPAALPVAGLDLRLRRRLPRLPAQLDEAQGLGRRQARAAATAPAPAASTSRTGPPTAGTSSATPTRSGNSPCTGTTPTLSGRSTRTSRTPARPRRSSSGPRTGCTSSPATSARGCTSSTSSGCTCSPRATAPARRTCTTPPWSINSEHKIRFAQDLALYNLTLSEEIEGFDGTAHLDAWNNDADVAGRPQGHRGGSPRSTTTGASRSSPPTSSSSRWSASCSGPTSCSRSRRGQRRLRHADRRRRR